jgi:hypothetical protein
MEIKYLVDVTISSISEIEQHIIDAEKKKELGQPLSDEGLLPVKTVIKKKEDEIVASFNSRMAELTKQYMTYKAEVDKLASTELTKLNKLKVESNIHIHI